MQTAEKERMLPHAVMSMQTAESLPDILLPYQQRVNGAMDTADVLFVEKSRRIGITWGVSANAVLIAAASRSAGGMDVFYIGFNLDMTREFIDTCASWARLIGQAALTVEEFVFDDGDDSDGIKAFRITFASGYEIVALTSRPRSLRGRQGYIIIDEAAFHDDLKELMKAALAMQVWGGRICVISTHDGVDNPFNEYIEEIKKGRLDYVLIRIDFDDALRDGLYRRRCLVKGDEWTEKAEAEFRDGIINRYGAGADEELFCIPSMSAGSYIPPALIEARMVDTPVIRLDCDDDFVYLAEAIRVKEIEEWCERELKPVLDALPRDLKTYLGEDFGRSCNLTVLWIFQLLQNMTRHTPFILELFNVPFKQQLQIIWYILDNLPRFMCSAFDARGNGSQIAEETMQRYGQARVHCVMITRQWYLDNVPPYKAGYEDGTITVPRDSDVKDDHRALVVSRGVPQVLDRDVKAEKGEKKAGKAVKKRHGDAAIAGVMAWFATRHEVVEYAYTPARQQDKQPGMRPNHDDDTPRLPPRRFSGHTGAF